MHVCVHVLKYEKNNIAGSRESFLFLNLDVRESNSWCKNCIILWETDVATIHLMHVHARAHVRCSSLILISAVSNLRP